MAKSEKIYKGNKKVGYVVRNKSGGQLFVAGGRGKDGYFGRTKPKKI